MLNFEDYLRINTHNEDIFNSSSTFISKLRNIIFCKTLYVQHVER